MTKAFKKHVKKYRPAKNYAKFEREMKFDGKVFYCPMLQSYSNILTCAIGNCEVKKCFYFKNEADRDEIRHYIKTKEEGSHRDLIVSCINFPLDPKKKKEKNIDVDSNNSNEE